METAIVGIIGALIGILLTNVLRVYFDRRNRKERVRDMQTALRAEIRSHRRALEYSDDHTRFADVVTRIETADYTPFVTREIDPPIFSAIVGELYVLPSGVIDAVVIFYRQVKSLGGLAEDMRGDTFRSLPAERKAQMYRGYFDLGRFAIELADAALGGIEAALNAKAVR
jgi:hypothetical protein